MFGCTRANNTKLFGNLPGIQKPNSCGSKFGVQWGLQNANVSCVYVSRVLPGAMMCVRVCVCRSIACILVNLCVCVVVYCSEICFLLEPPKIVSTIFHLMQIPATKQLRIFGKLRRFEQEKCLKNKYRNVVRQNKNVGSKGEFDNSRPGHV